ncbi:MAG: hypothetical protein LBI86_09990 [Treponema sp.]|nr:hypothetical protein [Treponema sp.]
MNPRPREAPGHEVPGALLSLVPPVLRARDFHLYTKAGRLTDLWQAGGAAVLGHTPPSVLRELKNAAERRLFVPFPHPLERRFLKALSLLFPGRSFRVYGPGSSLGGILKAAGFNCARPPDPAAGQTPPEQTPVSLWRPFADPLSPLAVPEHIPVLIPVLPVISPRYGAEADGPSWPCGIGVLALDPALEGAFPPPDIIAPALLAAAARGVYDLAAMADKRAGMPFQSGAWRRRGIYLTAAPDARNGDYAALFRRFLDGGFLLPPDPSLPAILPGVMSPGEKAKLTVLLAE